MTGIGSWRIIHTAPEKVRIHTIGTTNGWRPLAKRTLIRFGQKWWWPTYGFYVKEEIFAWKPILPRRKKSKR
jgi:hypothetical protein